MHALALRSIWTVLRLKERMVKLFMEHSSRQHMAAVGTSATQACSLRSLLWLLSGGLIRGNPF